jgi:hypothetical protein
MTRFIPTAFDAYADGWEVVPFQPAAPTDTTADFLIVCMDRGGVAGVG